MTTSTDRRERLAAMAKYQYVVTVTAASKDEADTIIGARTGYDEDLSEDGVGDYEIAVTTTPPDDPTLVVIERYCNSCGDDVQQTGLDGEWMHVDGTVMDHAVVLADDVRVRCPHCGAQDIRGHDTAVRWNRGDFEINDGQFYAWWATGGNAGDFDSDGYICGTCLRRDITLPDDTEHTYDTD